MSNYADKYVACPFYFKQEGRKLYCDGFRKGVHIHLSFSTTSLLDIHKTRHCNSIAGCKKCPIYPLINKQYEEEKGE